MNLSFATDSLVPNVFSSLDNANARITRYKNKQMFPGLPSGYNDWSNIFTKTKLFNLIKIHPQVQLKMQKYEHINKKVINI